MPAQLRRRRATGVVPGLFGAAARPVRPVQGHRQPRRCGEPAPGPVAMSRAAAGLGARTCGQPGRGHDARTAAASAGRRTRALPTAGQGRGTAPHRQFQGAWCRRRGLPGPRARRDRIGHAHERECRCRLVCLRSAGRSADGRRDAGGRATRGPGRDRRDRRRTAARGRADLRRGPPRQTPCRRRPFAHRRSNPEGAVPDRGQEDDRIRACRTTRLADARRSHLPDRWRSRPDRHPQGADRVARARLADRAAAALGLRAVHRLRTDRARVRNRSTRVGAVGRRAHRRVRHHRPQGTRRLPGPGRAARDGRDCHRGRRRGPAGRSTARRRSRGAGSSARKGQRRSRPPGSFGQAVGWAPTRRPCCSTPAPG